MVHCTWVLIYIYIYLYIHTRGFIILHCGLLLSSYLLNYFTFLVVVLLQLISATDRPRQSTDHPIKFISRRHPYSLKFKIKPGKKLVVYFNNQQYSDRPTNGLYLHDPWVWVRCSVCGNYLYPIRFWPISVNLLAISYFSSSCTPFWATQLKDWLFNPTHLSSLS